MENMQIEIKDLDYILDRNKILNKINLKFYKESINFLVGQSGSGKSTLLKIIGNLISETKGNIYYKGKSYKELKPSSLRMEVSYCSQIPVLFGETVLENMEFPYIIRNQNIDISRIRELFKLVNINEEYLHKNINELSGGEKQRLALVRSILILPKVLLLDEITSALDEENKILIEELVKKVNELGVTIIWVSHDMSQVKRLGGRIIKIESGNVVGGED